jgi:hypothetical protein
MANDRPLHILQSVAGTRVGTRPRLAGTGQDLLIEATPLGGRLAWLLAALDGGPEPGRERLEGRWFYAIPHSAGLDDGLTALIDALIDLRIAHPGLVQIELDLPDLDDAEGAP